MLSQIPNIPLAIQQGKLFSFGSFPCSSILQCNEPSIKRNLQNLLGLIETKMGCNTSKSTTVGESIPKPGRQPEDENKNEYLCTETTAEAVQNFSIMDNACGRASCNWILMYFKYRLQLRSKQLNYWYSALDGIDLCY